MSREIPPGSNGGFHVSTRTAAARAEDEKNKITIELAPGKQSVSKCFWGWNLPRASPASGGERRPEQSKLLLKQFPREHLRRRWHQTGKGLAGWRAGWCCHCAFGFGVLCCRTNRGKVLALSLLLSWVETDSLNGWISGKCSRALGLIGNVLAREKGGMLSSFFQSESGVCEYWNDDATPSCYKDQSARVECN